MKLSNNLIGVTGEYLVCGELGKRGILGLLTPKNNPLYDIVATNEEGDHTVYIQVKTMAATNKQGWKLGKYIEMPKNNPNLFIILVRLKQIDETPEFYVYQYDHFAQIIKERYIQYISIPKRNGDLRKDPEFRWHNIKEFTEVDYQALKKWDILGFG